MIKISLLLMFLTFPILAYKNDGFLYEINGNKIRKIDFSEIIKIEKAMGNNNCCLYSYKIYKYYSDYLLTGECSSLGVPFFYFYDKKTNLIEKSNQKKAYQYLYNKNVASLGETRTLLESILIIDGFEGFILDSLEYLCSQYRIDYCKKFDLISIKNQIHFSKPAIIKYADYNKHVYFVFSRLHQGGTLFMYEITLKNGKLQGELIKKEMFCFGDKWVRG